MPHQDRLLNEKQAAHLLGISPKTLRNWRYEGRGPVYRKTGRGAIRYRISDILKFIEPGLVAVNIKAGARRRKEASE